MIMQEIWDRNIALEWYKFGLERGDDFFIKFMMHWVAFNYIYNASETDEKELERILSFCKHNKETLEKYDAFADRKNGPISIFLESPIKNGHTGNVKWDQKNYHKAICNSNDIVALFAMMYQVRCNLFHGSKSIRIARDIALVKASSEILEGYLRVLLSVDNNSINQHEKSRI